MNEFAWMGNPVLVKCARVRLRRFQVVPLIVIAVIMAGFLMAAFLIGGNIKGTIHAYLAIQTAIVLLAGTMQVTAAVSQSVDSGMLDFHRIAPLPPRQVALGFLLGGPIREYLLAAVFIPFELVCVVLGQLGLGSLFLLLIAIVVNALFFHSIAMAGVMMGSKPSRARQAGLGLVIVAYMGGGAALMGHGPAFFTILPVYRNVFAEMMAAEGFTVEPLFYGVHVPAFMQTLIFQVPFMAFSFVVSVRKIRRDRMYSLSKSGAALLLGTAAFLTLGTLWNLTQLFHDPRHSADMILAITLTIATGAIALMLMPVVTPDVGDFVKGFRRALKRGRGRPTPWDDFASNQGVLAVFILTIVAAALLAWFPHVGLVVPPSPFWLVLVATIMLITHYGLAMQYMFFAHGRKTPTYFGFYLFLVWVVPGLTGALFSCGGLTDIALHATSFSPLASIPIAIEGTKGGPLTISLAMGAILVVVFHRRLKQTQREAEALAKPAPEGIRLG